jgi:hypothetical protein
MKKIFFLLLLISFLSAAGQQGKTENVIVITLDGFRWQELFNGADSTLIHHQKYTEDIKNMKEKFWAESADDRRKKLLPFTWNVIAQKGQLYGNRHFSNYVNNANPYWFSYPGYNEIFTGYPDTAVNSNDKIPNKNETVLEFLNKQPQFKGKIAAFTSWDVFPYIFNEPRSGIYVNSGFEKTESAKPALNLLNEMQQTTYRMLGDGVRPDLLTYYAAKEYLKEKRPRVLYIGFDETDDFAHGGKYDLYLQAAHMTDKLIADLWNYLQSQPVYKDKTTMIITTDHGRGDKNKDQWKDHGQKVEEASEIWIAVIGPDTAPAGEVKTAGQLYQRQIASTIAGFLGFSFRPSHPVMKAIETAFK